MLPPIEELQSHIHYTFRDPDLLLHALTHSSYANEATSKGEESQSNERLEFLGDSVLSLVVSRYLFEAYPTLSEGELSKIRAQTVCEKTLAGFARKIALGDFLLLGHGETQNKGNERDSILSDAFEALLAAIYLDSSLDAVTRFLLPLVSEQIREIIESHHTMDYKTMLQQIVQQSNGVILDYCIISEKGPAHRRVFEVEARLDGNVIGIGTGSSKREAEQNAAKVGLSYFGITE
ncbi:MAG: ribonuclease III [Clostridia bacterium]|nr:ribonuclease III [Clostridia bacterium]